MSKLDEYMGATPELRRMYLQQRQSLPLSVKVAMTKRRITEWYGAHNGMVYVAFSGGKDSTVLLHLVRSLYPEVPAVFADTGLEFPEIRDFVRQYDNVIWFDRGRESGLQEATAIHEDIVEVISAKPVESFWNGVIAYRQSILRLKEKV